jgi:hypothetical protein
MATRKKKAASKKPAAKKKAKPKAKVKAKAKPKAKVRAKAKPKAQARPNPKAKKKAASKPRPKKKPAPKTRRDATGHLDPSYAKDLRRMSRENAEHDDDRAFLVGDRADDALAQELGTEFVETVTSGEDEGIELRDQEVDEESGGPFVPSTAGKEFADEPDESNPPDATREPFPKS